MQTENAIRVVMERPGHHTFPIRPMDIQLHHGLRGVGRFGKAEVEWAAGHLVRYFQSRGGWYTFTLEELVYYYKLTGVDPSERLFGLLGAWFDDGPMCWRSGQDYLASYGDGTYCVTVLFIERCVAGTPLEDRLHRPAGAN